VVNKEKNKMNIEISRPSIEEVDRYLQIWDNIDKYILQESALNKLFIRTYPKNIDTDDVLIKVTSLNDFYNTNIFSPFIVAKHIVELDIDKRLETSDITLVNDIGRIKINNEKTINFYSFATKYCSHHKPLDFPIYDSYVDKILRYFMKNDNFYVFKILELREYPVFKKVLINFRKYYGLENYSLKDIDKYLWQLGKEKFPNKYY